MLYALGIADVQKLKQAFVDADTIPDAIDVPVQRVRLHELGRIPLILGFKVVRIDTKTRKINAARPYATIYTTTEADIGKTTRFEGDIFTVHQQISVGYPKFLQNHSIMALGRICFSYDFTTSSYSVPFDRIFQALREKMSVYEFKRQHDGAFISDGDISARLGLEAARFANIYDRIAETLNGRQEYGTSQSGTSQSGTQHSRTQHSLPLAAEIADSILGQAQAQWQEQVRRAIPTILATLSFTDLPYTSLGFPTRIYIQPLMPWIRHLARRL